MAKSAPKLKIRNFLPVSTAGIDKMDPAHSLTTAVNRLGDTVTDLGKIIVNTHQARLDAAFAVQGRKSLAQDRAREAKIEKKTSEEIDNEGKKRGIGRFGSGLFGFLTPLLEPLLKFAATIGTFFALDFLSKKENREMITKAFTWISKWLGLVWKTASFGFNLIYDGLFDPDGNDGPIIRVLKVIGGIAALKVASRILMPWKLAGDIGKLSKLFRGNRKSSVRQQQVKMDKERFFRGKRDPKGVRSGRTSKLARQRYARRFGGNAARNRFAGRIAGRGSFKGMTGMGRFMRSGVGGGIFAGALSFGSRLAAGDKMNVAAGGGIGATIGTVATTALLTPVLGPFAPIVGGILGGFIGDKIGAFIGEAIEPVLAPLGDFFKNIAFPLWKANVMPVVKAVQGVFEPLKALFGMMFDFVAPIATNAFKGIMDFIVGPLAKAALDGIVFLIEKAMWAIQNIGKFLSGAGNTLTRVLGSEGQKAMAQVENEEYDVKQLYKQLAELKAAKEKDGGKKRSVWWGVDGVKTTSNGADGMNIGNGHYHPFGSTTDEKIRHWENVLIPHAEQKLADARETLKQFEMAADARAQAQTSFIEPSEFQGSGDVRSPAGDKVQKALRRTIGFARGESNMCAHSVRQFLKNMGHPNWAKVATKTGNLDPDGTRYIGPGMAASFAGTDLGPLIKNESNLKPGDILLYRDTVRGKWTPGAVTHVGVYAGDGMQYDHNSRNGFHARTLAGVKTWGKFAGGIRLKSMPSQKKQEEPTKISNATSLNTRSNEVKTKSEEQNTELTGSNSSGGLVVMQPIIKPVETTVKTGTTTVSRPSKMSLLGI